MPVENLWLGLLTFDDLSLAKIYDVFINDCFSTYMGSSPIIVNYFFQIVLRKIYLLAACMGAIVICYQFMNDAFFI